jgi:hypothetical protein
VTTGVTTGGLVGGVGLGGERGMMESERGMQAREVEEVDGSTGGTAAGGGVVGSMMAAAGAAVEKVKVGGRGCWCPGGQRQWLCSCTSD